MGEFVARLSETAPLWRKAIAPIAEKAASMFWKSRAKPSAVRQIATRLTQTSRSKGRDAYRKALALQAPPEPLENRCSLCGEPIRKDAQCCAGCAPLVSRARLLQVSKLGRIATHTPTAEARRSATQLRQVAALKKWNPSDLPGWLDRDFYRRRILPKLPGVTIKKIGLTLHVSRPYAAMIRKGTQIPHPRHWLVLAQLTQ